MPFEIPSNPYRNRGRGLQGAGPDPRTVVPSTPTTPVPDPDPDPNPVLPQRPNMGGLPGFGGFNFTDVPNFDYTVYDLPDPQDIMNDPGYQWRLGQGQQALEQSAAARGLALTGGTMTDITNYAQNYAAEEYSNLVNRSQSEWDRIFRGEQAAYAPLLEQWMLTNQAHANAALQQYGAQTSWAELQARLQWEYEQAILAMQGAG